MAQQNRGLTAGSKNLKPFKKGQSGNPNGRPRKGVSAVLSALEAAGHDEVTAEQVRATMGRMLNLPRAELLKMGKDEANTPIMDALIARALVGKDGWSALNDMLDRAHGRARQAIDHTTNGKDIPGGTIDPKMPDDE